MHTRVCVCVCVCCNAVHKGIHIRVTMLSIKKNLVWDGMVMLPVNM